MMEHIPGYNRNPVSILVVLTGVGVFLCLLVLAGWTNVVGDE
jgi:hypothetical protein